jgi:hypothetical protein
MCLYTKQTTPLIADKDIIVYKVLEDDLKSPYMAFQFILNKLFSTSKEDKQILYEEFNHIQLGKIKTRIYSGYFHAFQYEEIANQEAAYLNIEEDGEYYIYEAIIPKGSKYYLGLNYQICSEEIIIKKKI